MDDEYERLMAQLTQVHAQGRAAHQRFEAAQARHDVDAMNMANEEHRALADAAQQLVVRLRAVVDAHFAPFNNPDNRKR